MAADCQGNSGAADLINLTIDAPQLRARDVDLLKCQDKSDSLVFVYKSFLLGLVSYFVLFLNFLGLA